MNDELFSSFLIEILKIFSLCDLYEALVNLYGWIKTRTRAKSKDMIAFVPSICPSIDHPQFALIQTLVKTTAKPAKTQPFVHNLVSN